jgi:lysozyme
MRCVTDEGLELIKRFEGFRPTLDLCPAGWPTIGNGHVVRDRERERFAAGIDDDQAEHLLRRDAGAAGCAVLWLIRVPLTDGQFDAVASFTYNLGPAALQRSTFRRKVNREEHGAVPAEIRRWVGGRRA